MSLVDLIQLVDEEKHQHKICFLCQHGSFLDKQGPLLLLQTDPPKELGYLPTERTNGM